MRDGDTIVGVVLVGSSSASFLPVAKAEALADITVYDFDGAPLATTFADIDNSDDADLTPADAAVAADVAAERHPRAQGPLRPRLRPPLRRARHPRRGRRPATPSPCRHRSSSRPAPPPATRSAASFTIGILAVLLVGWLVARSLTRPLLQLVGVARAVTAGDLNARARITRSTKSACSPTRSTR